MHVQTVANLMLKNMSTKISKLPVSGSVFKSLYCAYILILMLIYLIFYFNFI